MIIWPTISNKNYLSKALIANNMKVVFESGQLVNKSSFTDEQIQTFIDAFDYVPPAKEAKIAELKAEGLARIQQIFPSISNFDELNLVRNIMQSVLHTSYTADMQTLIDIYTAGANAQAAINALITLGEVESYDVTTAPVWP